MKYTIFTFVDDEFIIINSFDIINLNSLRMNFDFFFIFILTIFNSFQKQN